jgi:hypothetical protein
VLLFYSSIPIGVDGLVVAVSEIFDFAGSCGKVWF